MPRHVLTMIGMVVAFFALLWLGVVVLGQTPGRATLASMLTLILLGVGVNYSVSTFRGTSRDGE